MIQATIDREDERRRNAAHRRAALRAHFTGDGAVRRRWRFAYDAFVYGGLAAAGIVLIAAAAFGVAISIGVGHEDALGRLHAWMQATPFDQVRQSVGSFAGGVMRDALVFGVVAGPLLALMRTVPITLPAKRNRQ